MKSLSRRIATLETQYPALVSSGVRILLSDLDPRVADVLMSRNCDVEQMTLAELETLERELRRFTV